MKKILLLAGILLISFLSMASVDTTELETKVKAATIYPEGAQVFRSGKIYLAKGKHVIKLVDLYHALDEQSIQVEDIANCKIVSVKHERNYNANDKKDPEIKKYTDSIEQLNLKNRKIKIEALVLKEQENMLMQNKDFTDSKEGTKLGELKEALQYYSAKIKEIRIKLLELSLQIEDNAREMQKYKSKLQAKYRKTDDGTMEIFITLEALQNTKPSINFNYYIKEAGWKPLYDFRLVNIISPLEIDYKATIFQTTGYDWKGVDLKLSTLKPSVSGTQQKLAKWIADEYHLPVYKPQPRPTYENLSYSSSGALKGKVLDTETGHPIPFANIIVESNGKQVTGATTDFDGNYTIKPLTAGRYDVKATYVGYKPIMIQGVIISISKTTYQNIEMKSTMEQLDCVEVVSYKVPLISKDQTWSGGTFTADEISKMTNGSCSGGGGGNFGSGGIINIRGSRDISKSAYDGTNSREVKKDYTVQMKKALKRDFTIANKQDVPSSSEPFTIFVREKEIETEYVFSSIPKIVDEAYLLANIADWTSLDLLSGDANIFYEGTFVGGTYVDVDKINDTLSISLGRDNQMLINRKVNSKYDDKNSLGSSYSKNIEVEIQVQNLRSMPVNITLEDQYPISYRKSVKIDLKESSGAKIDEDEGILTWELKLEPQETKKIKFIYNVRYPKSMNVALEY